MFCFHQAWEHEYWAQHNQRPDRRALSSATSHIQKSYSTYYKLRTLYASSSTSLATQVASSQVAVLSNVTNEILPSSQTSPTQFAADAKTSIKPSEQSDFRPLDVIHDASLGHSSVSDNRLSVIAENNSEISKSATKESPILDKCTSESSCTQILPNKSVVPCLSEQKTDANSNGVWGKCLNRSADVAKEKKIDRAPFSELYSKLAGNMRASFLAEPKNTLPRVSLKKRHKTHIPNIVKGNLQTQKCANNGAFNNDEGSGGSARFLSDTTSFSTVDAVLPKNPFSTDVSVQNNCELIPRNSQNCNNEVNSSQQNFECSEESLTNTGNVDNMFSSNNTHSITPKIVTNIDEDVDFFGNSDSNILNKSNFRITSSSTTPLLHAVNVTSAHSTYSTRLAGKINSKWMKRCFESINEGENDVVYNFDDSNSPKDCETPLEQDNDTHNDASHQGQEDFPINGSADSPEMFDDDFVENSGDDLATGIENSVHEIPVVTGNEIVRITNRKRKKFESIEEELEENDKIVTLWPPPKKKRMSRIVKNSEEEIERQKLSIKAKRMKIETESFGVSPKRINRRTSRRKQLPQPAPPMSSAVFDAHVKDMIATSTADNSSVKILTSIESESVKRLCHSRENDVPPSIVKQTSSRSNNSNDNVDDMSAGDTTEKIPEYDEQLDMEKDKRKRFAGKSRYVEKNDRLSNKMKGGTINENFVKIDLKKKTFVRGKKFMTGSKYRRLEWKRKQGLKTASAGKGNAANNAKKLTCFKCGDFGHWASKCPGKRQPNSILSEADRPPVSFLTLDEAADMAKGIKINDQSTVTKLYSSTLTNYSLNTFENTDVNTEFTEETFDIDEPMLTVASELEMKEKIYNVSSDSETDNELESCVNIKKSTPSEDSTLTVVSKSTRNIIADFESEFHDDDCADSNDDVANPTSDTTIEQPVTLCSQGSISTYIGLRESIEPLLNKDLTRCPEEVMETLRLFGHSSFRPGQEKAILRILQGKSTLLVLSTGSGKSLCYQLPAYMYGKKNKCITLCVSPLVSLMEDQVTGLPGFLHAVCLHTNQTPQQREKSLQAVKDGRAHILLVSPEAVVASGAGGLLGTLMKDLPPLAFACVDEAHCVSQWSHNFRPSYLRVCSVLREQLGVRTILGLTATARHETTMNIAEHLLVEDPLEGILRGSTVPPNLQLSVSRDGNRTQALIQLLHGDRFENCDSIIVYCTRRDECEGVATLLRTQLLTASTIDVKANLKRNRSISFDAEAYHAGLSAYRRRTIQNRFMSGSLRIVVATVAFGMGIDKADVRAIIHYNMPQNLESYVQEIGRAGRDGLISHCHLFLDSTDGRDVQELKRFIFVNSIDRVTVRKLLDKVFVPCTCLKLNNINGNENITTPEKYRPCPRHEVALSVEQLVEYLDLPQENILTLLCYLELRSENLLQLLPSVYSSCTLACYGGPAQLCAVSKACPPLAVAIAKDNQRGISHQDSNAITFPVVQIASEMGWNSGVVKRELKALEWNTSGGVARRSGVKVEFSDLAFHLMVRGDLCDDDRDKILDELHARALKQETDQLRQLQYTHQTLRAASHASILLCSDQVDEKRCTSLKESIGRYFAPNSKELDKVVLEKDTELTCAQETGIRQDVRGLLSTHSDQTWTARAIARVFHGIQSPNFPANVWGRVRRIWRAQISVSFKHVLNIAQQEIIKWRKL